MVLRDAEVPQLLGEDEGVECVLALAAVLDRPAHVGVAGLVHRLAEGAQLGAAAMAELALARLAREAVALPLTQLLEQRGRGVFVQEVPHLLAECHVLLGPAVLHAAPPEVSNASRRASYHQRRGAAASGHLRYGALGVTVAGQE